MSPESSDVVNLSPKKFLIGCTAVALAFLVLGSRNPFSPIFLATEVMITILCLFVFGSIKYRLDKNALTYGAGLVIVATFWPLWKTTREPILLTQGIPWNTHVIETMKHYFLSLHGWDQLIHADTMLFILGLTFFVAAVAQTRLLETISFRVLEITKGRLVPTVAALTAIVAAASGVLDGVSMIGLMIRTLVILLFLAKIEKDQVIFAVMVSTIITTVCGMWLAYGEPPNLIMKTNLHPHLDNAFFIRYCLPAALGSYAIVFFNLRKRFTGKSVELSQLDLLDRHTDDFRFLQSLRRGKVLSSVEFIEENTETLGSHHEVILNHCQRGVPLGEALVNEGVAKAVRIQLLGDYLDPTLAQDLDDYYVHVYGHNDHQADQAAQRLKNVLKSTRKMRQRAQKIAVFSFVPFIGLLIGHAINHEIPLFMASFAGFAMALVGIMFHTKARQLALKEATHEFKEYLFLLPLFLSITLLQRTGFFDLAAQLIQTGITRIGVAPVALSQFGFATILSALLDNNVVADFAGRALQNLSVSLIHLFAMAQIAGYALGGCWTHIGSAQSVVAYAFIQKEVNPRFTPFQWIKAMTPVILQLSLFMTALIFLEAHFSKILG